MSTPQATQIEIRPTWLETPSFSTCRSHLNASPLLFNANELAHMAFMTGKMLLPSVIYMPSGSGAIYPSGSNFAQSLAYEFMGRLALLRAYFIPVQNSKTGYCDIFATALASNMDRSEKANASYLIGQSLAGLYCVRKLNATTVLHTSIFPGVVRAPLQSNKSPDLIALDTQSHLIVAEAKGRAHWAGSRVADEIAEQLCSVKGVESMHLGNCQVCSTCKACSNCGNRHPTSFKPVLVSPWRRVGTAAQWSVDGKPLQLKLICVHCLCGKPVDAVDIDEDEVQTILDQTRDRSLFLHYYRLLALLLLLIGDMEGDMSALDVDDELPDYYRIEVEALDVSVGLATRVADYVRDAASGLDAGSSILAADFTGFANGIVALTRDLSVENRDRADPRLMPDGSLFEFNWPALENDGQR